MKTVKMIIASLAFGLLSTSAIAGNTPTRSTHTIAKEVQHVLGANINVMGNTKKVSFSFTVNENGQVNAVASNVKEMGLRQNLESQFLKLNFKQLQTGITYSIDVNFITN